jgi:hypothetical protein
VQAIRETRRERGARGVYTEVYEQAPQRATQYRGWIVLNAFLFSRLSDMVWFAVVVGDYRR